MLVKHIIEDTESVFESVPESKDFGVAFASDLDDEKFFLVQAFAEACRPLTDSLWMASRDKLSP